MRPRRGLELRQRPPRLPGPRPWPPTRTPRVCVGVRETEGVAVFVRAARATQEHFEHLVESAVLSVATTVAGGPRLRGATETVLRVRRVVDGPPEVVARARSWAVPLHRLHSWISAGTGPLSTALAPVSKGGAGRGGNRSETAYKT